jgi:hypothetical protein
MAEFHAVQIKFSIQSVQSAPYNTHLYHLNSPRLTNCETFNSSVSTATGVGGLSGRFNIVSPGTPVPSIVSFQNYKGREQVHEVIYLAKITQAHYPCCHGDTDFEYANTYPMVSAFTPRAISCSVCSGTN